MAVPEWIKHHYPKPEALREMKSLLHSLHIHTVCEEAKCPNIGECFNKQTATFLILGDICTRKCKFCGIKKGIPLPVDYDEPQHIAKAVAKLNLSHTVITSVTRDDLEDSGSGQFVATIKEVKKVKPEITVEVLIPIMNNENLRRITVVAPEVINHNMETIKRLYPEVRPIYQYDDSLNLLAEIKSQNPSITTKSGFMVGLGETETEIVELMEDLRKQKVDIITIGQYLRPSGSQLPVVEYISPSQFKKYEDVGYKMGFKYVVSSPYVRSSYMAKEALTNAECPIKKGDKK
ncbi:MAG: lipoyl synthase [bacterium]|nr:lipoyl synthase [bacterium]